MVLLHLGKVLRKKGLLSKIFLANNDCRGLIFGGSFVGGGGGVNCRPEGVKLREGVNLYIYNHSII